MNAVVAGGVFSAGLINVINGHPVAALQSRPMWKTPTSVKTVFSQKFVSLSEKNNLKIKLGQIFKIFFERFSIFRISEICFTIYSNLPI